MKKSKPFNLNMRETIGLNMLSFKESHKSTHFYN